MWVNGRLELTMLPISPRLVASARARVVDVAGEVVEALRDRRKAFLAQLPDLIVAQVDAERPNPSVHGNEENAPAIVTCASKRIIAIKIS